MDTSEIVGLVVGILVVAFFAVVLYYLMRFLLKPKLHVPQHDIPRGSTVEAPGILPPHTYLRSTFVMQSFEYRTAANLISVMRDLRFQLFSVYCYQDLIRNIVGYSEDHSDDVVNLRQNMNLCYKDLSCLSQEIKTTLDAALDESERSVMASQEIYDKVVNNYEQLRQLGQKMKGYVYEMFKEGDNLQALTAYNFSIESIITESERKLFIFNGIREAASAVDSSSLGLAK
ncbi:hypothetical protein [Ehrlichia muris]|uniref:Uncharacterized protein n=1 Tax=Ehrlichia muris AS145 TaxID=1423892 RepID=V9R7E3_9RICK|nr:hypothetical protein [Ehrlichia muris]AHC39737.1 hypothetical protein EMUR_03755 [Ehrlichia muris AS145]